MVINVVARSFKELNLKWHLQQWLWAAFVLLGFQFFFSEWKQWSWVRTFINSTDCDNITELLCGAAEAPCSHTPSTQKWRKRLLHSGGGKNYLLPWHSYVQRHKKRRAQITGKSLLMTCVCFHKQWVISVHWKDTIAHDCSQPLSSVRIISKKP